MEEVVPELSLVLNRAPGPWAWAHFEASLDSLVHVPHTVIARAITLPGHASLTMTHVVAPLTLIHCGFIARVVLPIHHIVHLAIAATIAIFEHAFVDTTVQEVNATPTVEPALLKHSIEKRVVRMVKIFVTATLGVGVYAWDEIVVKPVSFTWVASLAGQMAFPALHIVIPFTIVNVAVSIIVEPPAWLPALHYYARVDIPVLVFDLTDLKVLQMATLTSKLPEKDLPGHGLIHAKLLRGPPAPLTFSPPALVHWAISIEADADAVAEPFQPRPTIEISDLLPTTRCLSKLTAETRAISFVMPTAELNVLLDVDLLSALCLKSGEQLGLIILQVSSPDIFELHLGLFIADLLVFRVSWGPVEHPLLVGELLHLLVVQHHVLHDLGTQALPDLQSPRD